MDRGTWQATVHEVTRVGHDLMQNHHHYLFRGFPGGAVVKNRPQCRGRRRCGFDPWVRKIPWKKKWQPDLVFLPGKFHGQRNLVGYSPWGHKESDTTEATTHTEKSLSCEFR